MEKDNRSFENVLHSVLQHLPKRPEILDLGCGFCYEASIIQEKLAPRRLVGVDNIPANIAHAKNLNVHVKKASFLHGDARQLNTFVQGKFDIIILRHPEIYLPKYSNVWKNVLFTLRQYLKSRGVLLITCYSDTERAILQEFLPSSGYSIILNQDNSLTFPVYFNQKMLYRDKYIFLAK